MGEGAALDDIARLRWQCRRGLLELDYLLEGFLDQKYAALSDEDKLRFITLLGYTDPDLQAWLINNEPVHDAEMAPIIAMLKTVRFDP